MSASESPEPIDFPSRFAALTGNRPFPWQQALFEQFVNGYIPSCCELPTGLGKTSIVAIWLMALAHFPAKIPRRLVYVVNRKTVVDQTTAEVERLRLNLESAGLKGVLARLRGSQNDTSLAISTLRGQFADNREWSVDPCRPAVIVGTVDMIGSRLLFSGYGIGFKVRPLHAGFLGQDALIVHDEAHLEPAFQKLIETIHAEQVRCKDFAPFRVMELTATARGKDNQPESGSTPKQEPPFELTPEEKNSPEVVPPPKDGEPPIHTVWRRLRADKRLHLKKADDDAKIAEEIADVALQHRKDVDGNDTNAAVLIFVRTPDDVKKVSDQLIKRGDGVTEDHVQPLTGTMRGLERDRMADPRKSDGSSVFARFLRPPKPDAPECERWNTEPMPGTVFLVCTSAGEVGIDISADHVVCDLSTFESMAQRFGRVNRYGLNIDTHITVIYPAKFDEKDKLSLARQAALKLLKELKDDASPKALGALTKRSDLPCKLADAFAPKPDVPLATDIIFDAWTLTSITRAMPGRPEVAPYLHGIAEDLPQITVAWRTELDLLKGYPNPEAALEAIFSKHRIRPHESLTVNSRYLIRFLKDITAGKVRPDLLDARVALIFSQSLRLTTIKALLEEPGPLNADPIFVLPTSFGGLDEKGMLAIPKTGTNKSHAPELDDAHGAAEDEVSEAENVLPLDVADNEGYERDPAAPARQRILIDRSDEGWKARVLPGTALPSEWKIYEPENTLTRLLKRLEKHLALKVRLVQPIKLDEEGDAVCSVVCLSPPPRQRTSIDQPLTDHVSAVEKEAERLAKSLLANDRVASAALHFAAKWHDEGKKSRRWQRYVGRQSESDPPLGKAAGWRDPKLLAGYRHEFGTLLRIADHEARRYFAEAALGLTTAEQQQCALELALHSIAAHHGYARPHFSYPRDEESTTTACEQTHLEVIRRFGRLQRRYGRWGLSYLESLLRAADWAASSAAGNNPEVDDDDAAGLEVEEA